MSIQTNSSEIFLDEVLRITNRDTSKWMSSGSRCFLYSPSDPAYSVCKYVNEKNDNNVSIASIDSNGETIKEFIVNESLNPSLYKEYCYFFDTIKIIAQNNANEVFFKTMVTHYTLPNFSNNR